MFASIFLLLASCQNLWLDQRAESLVIIVQVLYRRQQLGTTYTIVNTIQPSPSDHALRVDEIGAGHTVLRDNVEVAVVGQWKTEVPPTCQQPGSLCGPFTVEGQHVDTGFSKIIDVISQLHELLYTRSSPMCARENKNERSLIRQVITETVIHALRVGDGEVGGLLPDLRQQIYRVGAETGRVRRGKLGQEGAHCLQPRRIVGDHAAIGEGGGEITEFLRQRFVSFSGEADQPLLPLCLGE